MYKWLPGTLMCCLNMNYLVFCRTKAIVLLQYFLFFIYFLLKGTVCTHTTFLAKGEKYIDFSNEPICKDPSQVIPIGTQIWLSAYSVRLADVPICAFEVRRENSIFSQTGHVLVIFMYTGNSKRGEVCLATLFKLPLLKANIFPNN